MNKSKFLKKSLAMILAVMMVVAMIPLSASAAGSTKFVNDGTVVKITTVTGTLTGSGKEFTNALPYYAENENIAIDVTGDYTKVYYVVTDVDGEESDEASVEDAVAIADIPADTKKIVFFAADDYYDGEGEGTSSEKYTITFSKAAATSSTDIASAYIGTKGEVTAVTGTVNNKSKTVTFNVPWGYAENEDTANNTIVYTLENPTAADPTVTETFDLEAAMSDDGDTFTVVSQRNTTATWKVFVKEMTGLTKFTVAGVAATQDVNDDGELVPNKYTVTLPTDTDLSEKVEVKYAVANNNGIKVTEAKLGEDNFPTEAIVVEEKDYTLTLKNNKNGSVEYTITVEIADATTADITGFVAKTGGFSEVGHVKGDQLTVEMSSKVDLDDATFTIEFTTDADTITVGTVEAVNVVDGKATVEDVTLAEPVIVTATAEDGTEKFYNLTATVAEAVNTKPAITAGKMTVGSGDDAVEYSATISGTTITFSNVAYSTSVADVNAANFQWAKSQFSTLSDIDFNTDSKEDLFAGKNTISVTSDSGDMVTYTVKFVKAAAKTGKTLTSLSVSSAATSDKVAEDNTWIAKSGAKNTLTITVPYSFDKTTDLHATFEIPEGAALYVGDADNTNLNKTALTSGYETDKDETSYKEPLNTVKQHVMNDAGDAAEQNGLSTIVVADETAKVIINNTDDDIALETISKNKDLKGHITVYTVKWVNAAAKTGYKLKSFTDTEEHVTAKIGAEKVTITVPASYQTFTAVFTADEMAKVYFNTTTPTLAVSEETELEVGVDVDGDAHIGVAGDSDPDEFTTITVESESADKWVYDVEVVVADAKTGADLTAITVGGVKGSISTSAQTATVTLPYGTDLSELTIDYTASEMAAVELLDAENKYLEPSNPDKEEDEEYLYDLTDGKFIVFVVAEDQKTAHSYTVTVNTAAQFSDVPADAYYSADVYTAAQAGIIKGYANGSFKPQGYITRADFAIMVTRMLKADVSGYTTTPFSDVSASHYAAKEIAYCAEKGIITGRGNGKFDPRGEISRQDAATIIARALELTSTSTTTSFKDDAKIASYAKSAVAACSAAKIIEGDTNGNFRPTDSIKRCDTAIIMVRALNK